MVTRKHKILGLSVVLIISLSLVFNALAGWTDQSSLGNKDWYAVASSSDGTKLAAVVVNGYIYTSTDSGTNWSTNSNSSGSKTWVDIASSSDGTKLAAAEYGGDIYLSTNSGTSWAVSSSGTGNWMGIASSSDGTKLAAVTWGADIYLSTDSGANWASASAGNKNWHGITSSSDGTKLAAINYAGYIYTSTDSGTNWSTNSNSSGIKNWYAITSSSNGTKLAAVIDGGYIYTSTDSGTNWSTNSNSSGSKTWVDIASSSDGTKLVAATTSGDDGYMYLSTNSGTSWAQQTSVGNRNWSSIVSSSDATKLVAVVNSGHIYTYVQTVVPTVTTGSATSITNTTATLEGNIVNTGGENVTSRFIEYGTTTSYGSGNVEPSESFGAGSYTKNISGLTCNTLYHYRASAPNSAGTGYGSDATFTTAACSAPTVTTSAASGVTTTTARLNGNTTDNGGEDITSMGFYYGLTTGYGLNVIESPGPFGVGGYTEDITGLTCNTLYHYQAIAENSTGIGTGADLTFTTSACAVAPTPINNAGAVPVWILQGMSDRERAGQNVPSGLNPPILSENKFTKTLKYKDRDDEVKKLQEFLNANGFLIAKAGAGSLGNETNYFNFATKRALIAFKKSNGIKPATGYFGYSVRKIINESLGNTE